MVVLFQSTRPRGTRPSLDNAATFLIKVSIHAPAWDATSSSQQSPAHRVCFNPRARVGRDVSPLIYKAFMDGFNPRARVGRDMHSLLGMLLLA